VSAIPLRLQRIEGKYEILEKLREGGMGAIYKVRHRLLDEIRVIKLMRQQLVEDEELKARFLREARLAIKLRHPNIAQLYDFTVDEDGTAFIVMEFIEGMNLEDVLSFHGPPPIGMTLEIAQQSLRALGYLHSKGFVHRDISPDNLMLTEDADGHPLVKLIDLGIAKTLGGGGGESHLTQTGTFLGKIRYSSPEQFGADGAAMVDARGDLYSFGVVLYELLTARFPIQGRDPSSLIAGHLFRPPLDFAETDPQSRVPPDVRAAVLKALAKAPDDRFASAQEFSRTLALFRVPSDVDAGWKRLLARPYVNAGPTSSLLDPGSTQDRLDQQFQMGATPPPAPASDAGSPRPSLVPAPPPPTPSEAVRNTAGTIELQLKKGDLLTAETELRWAVDTYGERPELRTLRDRLQELKAQEAEAQARTLFEEARKLSGAGDLETALERLQQAQTLSPGNAEVVRLLEETRQALRRRQEEREKARELAAAVAEIEAALEKGDYRGAEALLYVAEASFGEQSAFPPLYARIEAARKRHEEVSELIAKARGLAAGQDFKGAAKELRRATRLDPGNAEATTLLEETEEAARRQAEEKRRTQQIAKDVRSVEERLRKGDLDGAQRILDEAVAEQGEVEAFQKLRARLNEERRARALSETVRDIRENLDRGALEPAGALLEKAISRFGAAETLREQWERLEELKRREQEARVQALITEARQLASGERFEDALSALRQATELAPDRSEIRVLTEEVQTALRWQKEEKRRAAELALEVAALEVHLDRGELDRAAKLLDKTAAVHGDRGELPQLRSRLETLQRKTRERATGTIQAAPGPQPREEPPLPELVLRKEPDLEDELEGIFEATQTIADLLSRREADQALKELHKATSRFGERPEFQELRKGIANVLIEDASPAPKTPQAETAPAPRPVPAPTLPPPPVTKTVELLPQPDPRPAPPAPSPALAVAGWKLWAGIAAAVLLLVAGFLVFRGGEEEAPESTTVETPSLTAPDSGTPAVVAGTLILDAVPWGEVVEITDGNGQLQPLRSQRYTPLVLSLPPGRYKVTLRNPGFANAVSLDVEVLSGAEVRSLAEFGAMKEEEFFGSLGW
jgi:eukaryotic-like serine/threonine-protein kinase